MGKFILKVLPVAALAFVFGCISPPEVRAQVTTGNIEGTVSDDKGNPAADVEVVATNQETGAYRIAYTAENGKYRISSLEPGTYQVRTLHINFTPVTKKDFKLLVGQTLLVDFQLTGKEVQEKEVIVEAHTPVIDTKKSDISAIVQPEQIMDLPLNSRNFLELADVAPGAKVSTAGRGPVTTGAVNSRFISAFIDGSEFKSDNLGGVVGTSFGATTNVIPEDAIREFQVITSLYKAEYSGASGGIINAITKEGGNNFTGTAFSYFRAADLDSRGAFQTTKPSFNRQQFGVTLGGPIVADQTHFFISYERDNINNFLTVFNRGVQPSLEGTFKSPTDENLLFAKFNNDFGPDNTLDVQWIHVDTQNNPGNFGNLFSYSNGFNLAFKINSLLATDKWTLGNNVINEFRVHYQRYLKEATPNSLDPAETYLTSGIVTGWNVNQPQTEDLQRYQIRDDISYMVPEMAGSHAFKGGINLEREPMAGNAAFFSGAEFFFRTDTSAQPFQGSIGSGNPFTSLSTMKYGIYGQDDWTVMPNLTLNLGLRWDVESNMTNRDYVNPFASDTALTNHVPADYIGNANRKIDYSDVAPRLGAAWDVFNDHSTVLHGGWGKFFDRVIYNVVSNEQQNGLYNIYTVRFGPTAPATTDRNTLLSYVQQGLGGGSAPAVVLLPQMVRSPFTKQWTAGISQQIDQDVALSLDYVQIRGFNEYTTYNVNYQLGIGGPRAATSHYGGINLLTTTGRSWYDAIQFGITRPYQNDWQMQLSYTLGWAFNTFDDPFQGYTLQSSIQRAPSLQDERHRFVLSGIVNLPFDFQLSGVATAASPRPLNVTTGTDDNHDGSTLDDFPLSGRNSYRPDIAKVRYWYKDLDLRLTKYFEIGGIGRIGIMADAFDVFNWTNYFSYFTILSQKDSQGRSLLGIANSAYPAREVQLGARIYF